MVSRAAWHYFHEHREVVSLASLNRCGKSGQDREGPNERLEGETVLPVAERACLRFSGDTDTTLWL